MLLVYFITLSFYCLWSAFATKRVQQTESFGLDALPMFVSAGQTAGRFFRSYWHGWKFTVPTSCQY